MIEKLILIILSIFSKKEAGLSGVLLAIERFLVGRLPEDEQKKYWERYKKAETLDDASRELRGIINPEYNSRDSDSGDK
jgi:hypothetical protein